MRKLLGGLRKRTSFARRDAVRSGLVTATSLAITTVTAGLAGVVLARTFGRDAETDGFSAAYGLYLVLVLAATAFRVVALPHLARGAREGRLGAEVAGFTAAFAVVGVPVLLAAWLWSDGIARLLTPAAESQRAAAAALGWFVAAALLQLLAALAASALAAVDDYVVAAIGYAAGGAVSLLFFVLLADEHGIVSLAWATMVNGVICLGVPLVALLARRRLGGLRAGRLEVGKRLRLFLEGAALPLAIQGLLVVSLRLAGGLGVGSQTSFLYAFLLASALVAVTASSLSLVSSVPLTHSGIEGGRAARHVVATAWLALVAVAGAAGIFALVGGRIVHGVLGDAFSDEAGRELGRTVVYLSPWMAASIALSVTFPLLFIAGRTKVLPALAVAALLVHIPFALAGRELLGIEGIALTLAVTTSLVLTALLALVSRATLAAAARGLLGAVTITGAIAAACFGLASIPLSGFAAAALGLAGYVAVLVVVRPAGLRAAWAYLHAL